MTTRKNKNICIHEELSTLLDKRGLLMRVSEETGTDYKRIHEIVTKKLDPGFVRGKTLKVWLECASMLAATRVDIKKGREIPFSRWCALNERRKDLPDEVSLKIDCVLELLAPETKLSGPADIADLKQQDDREQRFRSEAMEWIDSSISEMAEEIKSQLTTPLHA